MCHQKSVACLFFLIAVALSCAPETMQPAQKVDCLDVQPEEGFAIREAVFRQFMALSTAGNPRTPSVFYLGVGDSGDSGTESFIWDPEPELINRFTAEQPPTRPYSASFEETKGGRLAYSRTKDFAVLLATRRLCRLSESLVEVEAERYFFPMIGAGYTMRVELKSGNWTVSDVRQIWIE